MQKNNRINIEELPEPTMYIQTLLNPQLALPVKTPGAATQNSYQSKAQAIKVVSPSATGDVCLRWQPNALFTNDTAFSEMAIFNSPDYVAGSVAQFAATPVDMAVQNAIPPNTFTQYKIISASVSMFINHPSTYPEPLIQAGIVPSPAYAAYSGVGPWNTTAIAPISFEKCLFKDSITLQTNHVLEMCWIPTDKSDQDHLPVNTPTITRNGGGQTNVLFAIISGIRADCTVRFVFNVNYDAVTLPNSPLASSLTGPYSFDSIPFTGHLAKIPIYSQFVIREKIKQSYIANVFQSRFVYPGLQRVNLECWNQLFSNSVGLKISKKQAKKKQKKEKQNEEIKQMEKNDFNSFLSKQSKPSKSKSSIQPYKAKGSVNK